MNWDAAESTVQGAGHRPGQHGLADARHVLDEHVALAQHGHQHQLHHVGLADDDPAYVVLDPAGGRGQLSGS